MLGRSIFIVPSIPFLLISKWHLDRVKEWEGMKKFTCKFGDLFLSLDVRCKGEREREREREEFNVIFVLYFLFVL